MSLRWARTEPTFTAQCAQRGSSGPAFGLQGRAVGEACKSAREYETIPRNIAYYAGRSSQGSTLSRAVYGWVLARSDRPRAMDFFAQALQSDVNDIQQGTTAEGIHLGAMAGSVDLVQRVSTGIEVRGDVLWLNPELPSEMERLDLRIRYRGHALDLRLTRESLTVRGRDGSAPPISLCVDGKVCELVSNTTRVFRLNDDATDPGLPKRTGAA